jgi:hypothetical protein
LNGCWVTNEGSRHGQALGRNIADSCFHIVGDPFNKMAVIGENKTGLKMFQEGGTRLDKQVLQALKKGFLVSWYYK